MKRHYIYLLVDSSIESNIKTKYGIIKNKPFYVGKGTFTKIKTERYLVHYYDAINYRNINPHKERKIRKLLKSNNFSYEILYEDTDEKLVNNVEIELIDKLKRKCINKNGLLTNISSGGEGGWVWKDNPEAVNNIKKANKDKWKGSNNPNSKKNRKLEQTPSHLAAKNGNHWNKGNFKQLYEIYDSKTLISLGIYNSRNLVSKFNLKYKTFQASISQGKAVCNKYYISRIDSNLFIRLGPLKKLIDNGIVRTACIISKNKEYAEIDRNSLSPYKDKE